MADSLAFTTPAGDFGTMEWSGNHYLGPLPPNQPDFRPAYDALIAAGIKPTPYVAPGLDLAAYTSAAHAALRDGGVTVGGMRIRTDGESRGLIDGAYALSVAQPDTAIDFKAANGWVTIDAATMQTVAVAVGKWVQACYSAYRQVDGNVTSGAYTTPAQIDAAFAAVTLPA